MSRHDIVHIMNEQKKDQPSTSFRLSTEARRLLVLLAQRQGVSKTAIIELAIRKAARDEGL